MGSWLSSAAPTVGACSVLEKLQSLLHLCVRLQVQQQPVPAVGVGGAGLRVA